VLTQPQGTHDARIATLDISDQEIAYSKLKAWTGVQPHVPSRLRRLGAVESAGDAPPRLPPVFARALRARK
jgi:hypothetical protein